MRYSLRTMLTASKVIVYQKKKKTRGKVAVAQTIIRSIFYYIFGRLCIETSCTNIVKIC